MTKNTIKYPYMRADLIAYLESLSDLEYQKRCWVLRECPKGIAYDDLDESVHFLFDDTKLATKPESHIGWILKNESEADAIKAVAVSLNGIFTKYGMKLSDQEYIKKEEWKSVIASASKALMKLREA